MKNYDSRTYSVNDFVEWDRQKQLELNPIFQRRSIWNDKAKSYLIDTILRGKPIPKIFIRQKIMQQRECPFGRLSTVSSACGQFYPS